MAEAKYKVWVYKIDFKCDVCGKGRYRPTGEVLSTYPLQYPHKCNSCGAKMIVWGHTYPYTVTETAECETRRNLGEVPKLLLHKIMEHAHGRKQEKEPEDE